MVINAFASLLTTLVLFALATTWLWQEVRRQETRLDADPGAPQRTGKEMRLGLHTLLLAAAITRAIALVAEALHWGAGSCPLSWGCTLARTFPNLPLLSAHSLLALFFAQLSGCVAFVRAFGKGWRECSMTFRGLCKNICITIVRHASTKCS
jgi:hypothetical protein